MNVMRKRIIILPVIMVLFIAGLVFFMFEYTFNAKSWALFPANSHLYTKGELTRAGIIYDRNGTQLAWTENNKRTYNNEQKIREATAHAVGDSNGFVATGIQNAFRDKLGGYNLITGFYNFSGTGNDINLTIDANASKAALDALGSYKGFVGVYNYKTGELLVMLSTPTFDPSKALVLTNTEKTEGLYVNRFLNSIYPPGSTFKTVTAAAAIDTFPDYKNREYTCKQGVSINGEWISCLSNHGKLKFDRAYAISCNAYFSQLAVDLGKDKMAEYAEKFGFNRDFYIDGIKAKRSYYNNITARDVDLAWSGMGQFTNLFGPLQYLTAMGAIANGGIPVKPYMIQNVTSQEGIKSSKGSAKKGSRMLSKDTADKLADAMRYNTTSFYGDSRYPELSLAAKTGTAELNHGEIAHSVFVGFSTNEQTPYAFVVLVENAGLGIGKASDVANKTLQALK